MRKQENVFITFQASNWKNRDQYSRTSFNGVKNNPPQDRQESLIAKQTGQLGLGRASWDSSTGAIPAASAATKDGEPGKAEYPPPKIFLPSFFHPCSFPFSLVAAETLGVQAPTPGWEMGTTSP